MIELGCTILLPKLFTTRDEGREFLQVFLRWFPGHTPQRYGRQEPLKKKWNGDLNLILEEWGPSDFIADRRNPDLYLQVFFSQESLPRPRHTVVYIHRFRTPERTCVSAFKGFVTEIAQIFGSDLAVAHILTIAEFSERIDYLRSLQGSNPEFMLRKAEKQGLGATLGGMTIGQYTVHRQLKQYLPDLPWLTIFGKPYIDLFGIERLRSTPAHEVQQISDRLILLNVAQEIADTPQGWADFKAVRDRCKHHLNSNAFFDPSAPRGHPYSVPGFRFPPEMCRADFPLPSK